MFLMNGRITHYLERLVADAISAVGADIGGTKIEIERAPEKEGDYMTNIALAAKDFHNMPPPEFAEKVGRQIKDDAIENVSVAGPGFLNFTLSGETIIAKLTEETLARDARAQKSRKVNLEFISANPTGQLHLGHGRGAFFGDVLGNVYEETGYAVTREYYINDSRESTQIKELGKTALGAGEQYKTALVEQLIKNIDLSGMDEVQAGVALAEKIQEHNKSVIEQKLGISFDRWYSEEKELRAAGKVEKTAKQLKKKDLAYEDDGATWIKTSQYGDDDDRVIIRSDGAPSYFLSDIAYHADKIARGFDILEDVWGADHHGHVARMQAVRKMLGWEPELFIHVAQLVSLKEEGQVKKMSKRAGTIVLLEDLVEGLGTDVVRWFFAERALSTHMEFDLELAQDQSDKNPVFYVQYAHARACSIEKKAGRAGSKAFSEELLSTPAARALAMKIIQYPEIIHRIIQTHELHRLPQYATDLASAFSAFYRDVRVIDEQGNIDEQALSFVSLTKTMLARTLSLLGISAPEEM